MLNITHWMIDTFYGQKLALNLANSIASSPTYWILAFTVSYLVSYLCHWPQPQWLWQWQCLCREQSEVFHLSDSSLSTKEGNMQNRVVRIP